MITMQYLDVASTLPASMGQPLPGQNAHPVNARENPDKRGGGTPPGTAPCDHPPLLTEDSPQPARSLKVPQPGEPGIE